MFTKIQTTPLGTSGLTVEPWSVGEVYGVAANWSQASAPVYTYGPDGWFQNGRQVADYQHSVTNALAEEITEAIASSGDDDDVDTDDVDSIVADAKPC